MDVNNFLFRIAWNGLAEQGQCDEADSAEFKRVYSEWKEEGFPGNPSLFIRARANIGQEKKE